jgi:spermidine synthase
MTAFILLGFFSLLAQVFALKELSALLTAHEAVLGLGLSAWLLWTAVGMMLALRRGPGSVTRDAGNVPGPDPGPRATRHGTPAVCVLFTAAAGANLILLRNAGFLIKPGLLPDLLQLILFSFLLTLPAALANGLCLAQGLSEKRLAFYRAETAGAAAAGLLTLAHAFYFPGVDPFLILGIAATALIIVIPGNFGKGAGKPTAAILTAALYLGGAKFAPPFALPGAFHNISAYARAGGSRLALSVSGGQKTFIEDGAVLAQLPPSEQSEVFAHIPLLAHKKPDEVLLLGPVGIFLAGEAEEHGPKNITITDPDRFRTTFLLKNSGLNPGSARIERADSRAFLKTRKGKYDVIFQTTPEPLNAATNRFFTKEFFLNAAAALKKGGILAFSLPFSENYLPPARAYLAASVLASASPAFNYLEYIPGGTLVVLASDSPIDLSPAILAGRYDKRKLKTRYTAPANLPFLLDPYRRQWALGALAKVKTPPRNEDLNPAAYFYLWKMWLALFVSPGELTGLALFVIAMLLAAGKLLRRGGPLRGRETAGVFLAGAWAMGFEVVCLFMFQNHSGPLSWKLGTLFAAFMAGSAAGAVALKVFPCARARAVSLALALTLTAGLYYYAPRLENLRPAELFAFFTGLLFCGGMALGGYFAAATSGEDDATARLYYADLLGAALGGFVFSAALIPLAGLRAALLLAGTTLALIPLTALIHSLKESTVKV